MKTIQQNIGTVAKRFASVVCLLSLVLAFAPSAQAYTPPTDLEKHFISTDNEYETEYNPFVEPLTMPHWMSNLTRHTCWTNYIGDIGNETNNCSGFYASWQQGTWFIATNRHYTVNMPKDYGEYYTKVQTGFWNRKDGLGNFVGNENTCLARIQKAAEAKLSGGGLGTDETVGENVTVALCQLLRPHEAGPKGHDQASDGGPHCYVVSNTFESLHTDTRVWKDRSFVAGLRLDADSWMRGDKIFDFTYVKYSRQPEKQAAQEDSSPTRVVELFNEHYGPGIRSCIATLDKVPADWTGTYTLHNRDYGRTEVTETVKYVAYDGISSPVETTTNRTRTVTGPDAWPAFDEDVELDRGDVLIMKSICHLGDAAVQMLRAYKLPVEHIGTRADQATTNLVKVQEALHAIGYTDHSPFYSNRIDRVGYSDRIEHAIHDLYHLLPTFLESIDDSDALAAARTAYVNGLESFLDADAFIFGKEESKTGKKITGKRNPDQLHLIEFDESDDEGGEWNIAGWREFAEKTYASLKGQGTDAKVQTLDLVDVGSMLDIHAGSQGNASDAEHGVIDFSGLGPNKDGKVAFDMNAFFDGKITRNAVILNGSAIATNGPAHYVATRRCTPDGQGCYGEGTPKEMPYYRLVNRLHLALGPSTVSPTLNGLYPSGTLIDDLATMKGQFPASGAALRTGFAKMVDVYTCERTQLGAGASTNLVAGTTYTAAPATGNGGVFSVGKGATLTGTNVTFAGNSASLGGAIFNKSGVVTLTHATFKDNVSSMDGGAINNNPSGVLNLNDVAFENNTAGYEFAGGAICNFGTANLLGPVSLVTTNDTLFNIVLLNWDLTGEPTGVLNGYDKLTNSGGTLQITVDDDTIAASPITIATGDFSDLAGKDTFTITNALGGAAATIQIGGITVAGGYLYKLEIAEAPEATPPTTNLVLSVVEPDMSHVIVNSNWAGKYKLGDEIEIEGKTYYYGINAVAEMPAAGLLVDTETLEIAGGSAAITNAVTLKKDESGNPIGKLVIDNGAALSIMGEGSITNSLAAANSISGSGAIYLDKWLTDDQLKNYTDKLAPGSAITVARASVDDKAVKETAKVEEGGKTYYNVITSAQPTSGETNNTVVTSAIVVDGAGDTDGLLLKTNDEKPLIVAGSVTTTVPDQSLKLVKEQAADLTVNGKVSGFETIAVENKNETGKMTTTSTLAANKNITISNDGHLDAKALAGGNIDINNTSANTIIGEYSGQYVNITNTATGVAQDITLQAYGKDGSVGYIRLFGDAGSTAGSIYSNVTLVAGNNATPSDISANDGKGTIQAFDGVSTLSGTVLMRSDKVSKSGGGSLRFENADVTCSASQVAVNTEIYGECNIASNDNGAVLFTGNLTLKDGAVLGGKTRLASSCNNNNFVLEGTVTFDDGAELSRTSSWKDFDIPAGATLVTKGAKISCSSFHSYGEWVVEAGTNTLEFANACSLCKSSRLVLKKGAELFAQSFVQEGGRIDLAGGTLIGKLWGAGGIQNWNLTEGTTTLNWAQMKSIGTLLATVGNVAGGTSYLLATNATTFAQTLTITNITAEAAAQVSVGGVCKVAGQFWALSVLNGELRLAALAPVKLTDVFLIDEETGKTNATAVVKFGGQTISPSADGSFEVPANYPLDVVYEAAGYGTDDGNMFGPGWQYKTVTLPNGIAGNASLDDPEYADLKASVAAQCQAQWVESETGRTLALDTRTRIVVAEPTEVLPLAYSTNNWGAVAGEPGFGGNEVQLIGKDAGVYTNFVENGYYDWMPESEEYGAYKFVQQWSDDNGPCGATNATIYYTTYFPLTLPEAAQVGGTISATLDGATISSTTNILGYSYVNLEATPADHYMFTGWAATAGSFTNESTLVTRFEMPNSGATISAAFAWQSTFTDAKTVGAGETWEVFEGDDYQKGITNNGTIVWKPGTVNAEGKASGLDKFSQLENYGTLQLAFDETPTNGTYKIAGDAADAVGQTFQITEGGMTGDCVVVSVPFDPETATWTYVGSKRYALVVESDGTLYLIVEDGRFTISYDAAGGAWKDGAEVSNILTYVITGYQLPEADPFRKGGYEFVDWNTKPEGAGETVTNDMPFVAYADHAIYANWKPGFAFDETQYAVKEGGALKVYVHGGLTNTATQVTLSFVKGTGSYTAAYMNGKEVTLPLRLNWAKGEVATKEILFQTEEDEDSKYDRTFTLQLSSPVGEEVLAAQDVCTVTLLDAQGGHKQYSYVRALAYPANAGTVTGAGKLTSKTTERVLQVEDAGIGTFKGWYAAKEDDPNVPDLKHRLTKKAKYTADEPGTYFAYFADVQAVSAVVAPDASEGEGVDFDAETETYLGTVGVKFRLPCACTEDGTLKVTGRPDGLSWKNGELVGVPTEAGTYKVKFTATNDAGAHVIRYVFKIAEMPKQAIGTWEGVVRDSFDPGIGSITFTASSVGDLSAKVVTQFAGTQSFEGEGYTKIDDDTYDVYLESKGGEILTATLYLTAGWGEPQLEGYYDVSQSEYWSEYAESGDFQIIRNPYDKETGDPEARQRLAEYVGTYEETLYRDGRDKGDVSFKVKSNGKVVIKADFSSKEFSGTVAGGIKVSEDGSGWIETALRGDRCIWSADADLDSAKGAATGAARYINKSGNNYDYTIGEGEPQ